MLEIDKRRLDYWSTDSIITDTINGTGIENPTAKDVLTYMIGDRDNWCGGDYVVYRYNHKKKRTLIQRLNMLWVYPLFIINIPLQYLFTGDVGLNRNSKAGKIVHWLVKLGD